MVVLEEILINSPGLTGSQSPLVTADLLFFETPSGGAVFSTGSIAYSGSLSHNDYDNNVSKLTENVVNRFKAPEPFAFPGIDSWPGSN
jgi:N,N-dimethylformamidase